MSKPQHPLARPVGYAIVIAVLVGLFLAAGFLVREATRSPRLIRVQFPEIATLAEGDPVVQGGVPVGKIASIRLASGASTSSTTDALVEIELFHHNPLAADARFVNFSHSLMGARKVWIRPGVSPLPLDESRIQQGYFQPGLSETMHKVDTLVVLIARLREEAERLLTENDPSRSPIAATLLMEGRLDTAARQLAALSGRLDGARTALEAGLTGFSSAAQNVRQGVRAAEPPVQANLKQAKNLVLALETVQQNLDSLMTRLEKVTALAGDSTPAGKLLNSSTAYDHLERSVRLLEKAARLMQKDGLDSLKIRPRLRSKKG